MPSKKLRLSRVTGSEASEVSSEDFKPSRMRFIFRFFRFDRFLFSSIFLFSYITSKTRTWNLTFTCAPSSRTPALSQTWTPSQSI